MPARAGALSAGESERLISPSGCHDRPRPPCCRHTVSTRRPQLMGTRRSVLHALSLGLMLTVVMSACAPAAAPSPTAPAAAAAKPTEAPQPAAPAASPA